ncbi:hypothetical protein APX70_200440 [Pseudomonas syringae pv. maculicola]|uniref:Uncharacterized protein n=1 Tax=Pseudomonas syringae pv. maculicola TaxID=59511 RepID=A0A3M2UNT7_PSEYM|nr:hypothetical protein APX70_200440 [Pseudomonas syringae pv. maculicola]
MRLPPNCTRPRKRWFWATVVKPLSNTLACTRLASDNMPSLATCVSNCRR